MKGNSMDTETRDRLAEMKSDIALLRQRLETLQWNLEEIETDEAITQEVDIISGPGVQVSRSGKTYVVSADIAAADSVLARVDDGSAAHGYSVTLYGNGMGSGPTGTGTLFLTDVAADGYADLVVGTVVVAHPATTQSIEGG